VGKKVLTQGILRTAFLRIAQPKCPYLAQELGLDRFPQISTHHCPHSEVPEKLDQPTVKALPTCQLI
jgi:hypothetical protein